MCISSTSLQHQFVASPVNILVNRWLKTLSYRQVDIDKAIKQLEEADLLIGHNIVGFDFPAIKKVYPNFKTPQHLDTLLCSRLIWSDIKENDYKFAQNYEMPGDCFGKHSLNLSAVLSQSQ